MRSGILALSAVIGLLCALWIAVPSPHAAAAGAGATEPHNTAAPSLGDTLTNGLRVTRQDQQDLIDRVVRYVNHGQLPASLVYASFRWARKRYPDHPFPYFVQALRVLAKRYDIDL